jgi:hypothetical protein
MRSLNNRREIIWGENETGKHTFEDIPHLTEGLILASGENLHSCLKIANLKSGDKRDHYRAEDIPEGRVGAYALLLAQAELALRDSVLVTACSL